MHQDIRLQGLARKLSWKLGLSFVAVCAVCLLAPCGAQAHIKWFCPYDTSIPPRSLAEVVTPSFAFIAAGFGTLMFVAYVIDRVVERNGWFDLFDRMLLRHEAAALVLVRGGVCVFFLILWMDGTTILTPELKTSSAWVPWLQLGIAAFTLWRPTLVLAGIGIATLYAYGVARYGAFHMLDYPIFLGLAAYLGLSAFDSPFLLRLRLPALYFNLVVTMMWGAIEKFGYPNWTFPLLATHKSLALGMPFGLFMTVAGFVELSLAFFMLTGTALLRFSCLALLLIMASAIPEFGKVDAIGHSLIIVTLIVMIMAGRRGIELPRVIRGRGVLASSGLLSVAYGATTLGLLVVYHGAQYVAGR